MTDKKEKLVIFDGNAIVHRAWHALPPTLRTSKGELVNAVFGFTSILLKVLKDLKPKYVAVAFDRKGPTFRHKEFPEYKAQRVKKPQDFYDQFTRVKQVVAAFNIPIFESSGFEADDLIGTVVSHPKVKKLDRVIVTGDMDTLQLIEPGVTVYALRQGISDTITYDDAAVRDRFGLTPGQMVDYKALRGDPSDNIQGVPGIGEKTAATLLGQFDTLENLYTHLDDKKIPDRIRKLLTDHRAEALQAKNLVQLVRDVPLDFDLSACQLSDYDPQKVVKLFSELEFKSLVPRLPKAAAPVASTATQGTLTLTASGVLHPEQKNWGNDGYRLIDTEEKFRDFIAQARQQKLVAIDTETTSLDPLTAKLVGVSMSWQNGEAVFILPKPEWMSELRTVLENPNIGKAGHNLKFDLQSLETAGIAVSGIAFDTMVASYLLNPGTRQHNLGDLAFSEFGYQMQEITDLIGKGKDQRTMADVPIQQVSDYSCADADYTFRLVGKLKQALEQRNQLGLLEKIELPLIPVLATMERNGVKIDSTFLNKMSKDVGKKLAALETKIHKLAGVPFNIASPLQLKEVLFGKLNISAMGLGRTKTGISTAAGELEKLTGAHKIIPMILEYRELSKLQSTYLEALPQLVSAADHRLHTSYNQTVAATGRLSSSDPNLQNIPIRTPLGAQIRKAFIAERGYRLLSADYNQIELRIIASLAEDPTMIKIFQNGEDVHAATASEIHDVPLEKVTKALRRTAKEVNFGIIYRMGAMGLSQRQGISRDKAKAFIDKYFQLHPKIAEYLEVTKRLALELGYVETIFGRRRYLPEIASSAPQIRSAAERAAINHPIQGTAADMIKLAMIALQEKLPTVSPKAKMIMQVHDELVFEVPEDDVPKTAAFIKDTMENVFKLRVPILVHVGVGKSWGTLKPVE
ncbi:MAG: DNA polymerase I [Patescibacteria group bacterium]|nr:DNA polymerase I [Patescibacteria group bacterium]